MARTPALIRQTPTLSTLLALTPTFMLGTRSMERSEEHTSELQSRLHLVCRLLLEKKTKHNHAIVSLTFLRHTTAYPESPLLRCQHCFTNLVSLALTPVHLTGTTTETPPRATGQIV